MSVSKEVRITDQLSGGEKGQKPEAFALMPSEGLEEIARVFGYGALKYESRNWERGYSWNLSISALERHISAFKRREDFDAESGLHHLAHAGAHCLFMLAWVKYKLGTDDRSLMSVGGSAQVGELVAEIAKNGPAAGPGPAPAGKRWVYLSTQDKWFLRRTKNRMRKPEAGKRGKDRNGRVRR